MKYIQRYQRWHLFRGFRWLLLSLLLRIASLQSCYTQFLLPQLHTFFLRHQQHHKMIPSIMFSTRSISLFLLFLSSVSAGSLRAGDEGLNTESLFRAWSDTHGKDYGSDKEHAKRLKVWLANHGKQLSLYCMLWGDVMAACNGLPGSSKLLPSWWWAGSGNQIPTPRRPYCFYWSVRENHVSQPNCSAHARLCPNLILIYG